VDEFAVTALSIF